MEEARSHYSRVIGRDYASFERAGYFMSVVDIQVRYRAPSRYGDQVAIHCWINEVKSRTVTFGYEVNIAGSDILCATGHSGHICVTREGRVTSWPEEWKEWLTAGLPRSK